MAKSDSTLITVAAIGAGVILFYPEIKKLVSGVSNVTGGVGTAAQGAGEGISIALTGIGQGASDIGKSAGEVARGVSSPFGYVDALLDVPTQKKIAEAQEIIENEKSRQQVLKNLEFQTKVEKIQRETRADRTEAEIKAYETRLKNLQKTNEITIKYSPDVTKSQEKAFLNLYNKATSQGFTSLADYYRGKVTVPTTQPISGSRPQSALRRTLTTVAGGLFASNPLNAPFVAATRLLRS